MYLISNTKDFKTLNKINTANSILHWCYILYICIHILFSNNIDSYTLTSAYITYDLGFISRGFIGTFFYNLAPKENFVHTVFFIWRLLTVIAILLLNIKFQKYLNDIKNITTKCILNFMLFLPTYIHFTIMNYDTRLDTFWLLLFLVMLYVLENNKMHIYMKTAICTILSSLAIIIHQGAVFMIAPFIALYIWQDKKIPTIFIYGIPVSASFLICQFAAKPNINIVKSDINNKLNRTDFFTHFADKADLELVMTMLELEYNIPVTKHIINGGINNCIIINACITIAAIIFFVISLWALHTILLKSIFKTYERICLIAPLIITCVLTIDYFRWFGLYVLLSVMTATSILKTKNINVSSETYVTKDIKTYVSYLILNIICTIVFISFLLTIINMLQ